MICDHSALLHATVLYPMRVFLDQCIMSMQSKQVLQYYYIRQHKIAKHSKRLSRRGEKHTLNPEEVGHISAHVTMRCAQVEIIVCFTFV